MRGLPSILSLFRKEFNKFNNTGARMLDSIYQMTFTPAYLSSLLPPLVGAMSRYPLRNSEQY